MFFDVGNSKQSLRELKERVWTTTFEISYSSIPLLSWKNRTC